MDDFKKKTTLTFDVSQPEQAMVYEYLQSFGRKQTKQVVMLVSEQIKKENAFAYQIQNIRKALFEDENFINTIKESLLQEIHKDEIEKTDHKENVPESEQYETNQKKPIEEIDLDLIMQGVDMFSQS